MFNGTFGCFERMPFASARQWNNSISYPEHKQGSRTAVGESGVHEENSENAILAKQRPSMRTMQKVGKSWLIILTLSTPREREDF